MHSHAILIVESVGLGQRNQARDVRVVQRLLNLWLGKLAPLKPLLIDGTCEGSTLNAIWTFQCNFLCMSKPDRIVSPHGRTWQVLNSGQVRHRLIARTEPKKPLAHAAPTITVSVEEGFEKLLRLREGVRLDVYPDSLKKPTVGIGHLVTSDDNLKVGDKITDEQVSSFFKIDGAKALSAARAQAAEAGIGDSNFLIYLASVNFQLGTGWRKIFKNTWKLIAGGSYIAAAEAVHGTRWQKQTPVRVKDFQYALRHLANKP